MGNPVTDGTFDTLITILLIPSLLSLLLVAIRSSGTSRSTLKHVAMSPITLLWVVPWFAFLCVVMVAANSRLIGAAPAFSSVLVGFVFIVTGILGFAAPYVVRLAVTYENLWRWYGPNVTAREVAIVPVLYSRLVKELDIHSHSKEARDKDLTTRVSVAGVMMVSG